MYPNNNTQTMFLVIKPHEIIFIAFLILLLYIVAISNLVKNKSGIFPYVLLLFPIVGPLGIIIGTRKLRK